MMHGQLGKAISSPWQWFHVETDYVDHSGSPRYIFEEVWVMIKLFL